MSLTTEEIRARVRKAERLSLFGELLDEPVFDIYLELLRSLLGTDSDLVAQRYSRLFDAVTRININYLGSENGPDVWQAYLLEKIIASENAFTLSAETGMPILTPLANQAKQDLSTLGELYRLSGDLLAEIVSAAIGDQVVSFAGLRPQLTTRAAKLSKIKNWDTSAAALSGMVRATGAGVLGQYNAFRWLNDRKMMQGVDYPDPISLNQLFLYDWQREELLRNTQKLVAGLPANNALLYGDKGTGKSSTVKAVAKALEDQGLRLIEMPKESLSDFPLVFSQVRTRIQKFIIFIDDLSFEEDDAQYKALKAVLEGGIQSRPDNVVLYATSNRRNLVKERFSDRNEQGLDAEINLTDSYQEKQSLADRFGLRLPFLTPDQEEYLTIVSRLIKLRGLKVDKCTLRSEALKWQGRSGRAAKQFVDWLDGELSLDAVSR